MIAEHIFTGALPQKRDVELIVQALLEETVSDCARFPTGNHHYVYDVTMQSGKKYVTRLTLPEEKRHFEGALYWSEHLRPLGIPLAEILASDLTCNAIAFPCLILERLPGKDLGTVYSTLSKVEKQTLANSITAIHQRLQGLPNGNGFGYSPNYTGQYTRWSDVIKSSIDRSRSRIISANVFNSTCADHLEEKVIKLERYFADIQPRPFLHDTTTQNVIIDNGRLSGIVDVDSICFGDALLTPALTHMALLSVSKDTDYIEYWLETLHLSKVQYRAFIFYTAQCCLDFMGEIGQNFNGNPSKSDEKYCNHLSSLFEELIHGL